MRTMKRGSQDTAVTVCTNQTQVPCAVCDAQGLLPAAQLLTQPASCLPQVLCPLSALCRSLGYLESFLEASETNL